MLICLEIEISNHSVGFHMNYAELRCIQFQIAIPSLEQGWFVWSVNYLANEIFWFEFLKVNFSQKFN